MNFCDEELLVTYALQQSTIAVRILVIAFSNQHQYEYRDQSHQQPVLCLDAGSAAEIAEPNVKVQNFLGNMDVNLMLQIIYILMLTLLMQLGRQSL